MTATNGGIPHYLLMNEIDAVANKIKDRANALLLTEFDIVRAGDVDKHGLLHI